MSKLRGEFHLRVINAETSELRDERRFDNLIVDVGLERWARGWPNAANFVCVVGTGNSAPLPSNSALDNRVASVDIVVSSGGAKGAPNYEVYQRFTGRFPAGTFNGTNLSEIGIMHNGGVLLWCRQLILDEHGNPSTITVLQNEYLDVSYTLYDYPNLQDVPFSFEMDGVMYNCVSRCAEAGRFHVSVTGGNYLFYNQAPQTQTYYATQTLGDITSRPAGTSVSGYLQGSHLAWDAAKPYTRTYELVIPQNTGNVSGGIGSIFLVDFYGPHARQISFDPVLPKDANTQITLIFSNTVSRYTP